MVPEAEEAKKLGNECAKAEKYLEAMLHYSRAIKLAPNNATLYSNRALMLLKAQQYYNGMQDALMAIKLMPNWEKGYFRLGEIQFAAEHYQDALWSYKQALQIAQNDTKLEECIKTTTKKLSEQRKADSRHPLYGIGVGFLMALCIIIANEVLVKKSAIENDILKVLLVAAISAIGYGMGLGYRYIIQSQRASQLEAPIDLLADMSPKTGNGEPTTTTSPNSSSTSSSAKPKTRQSKASARHRMKAGKS